jgi:hypothetical protein
MTVTNFSSTYKTVNKLIEQASGSTFFVDIVDNDGEFTITITINGRTKEIKTTRDWFTTQYIKDGRFDISVLSDKIKKNAQLDSWLEYLGLTREDFLVSQKYCPNHFCVFGCPQSTDCDVMIIMSKKLYFDFLNGLLDIDTSIIETKLRELGHKGDFDFNVCCLRDSPNGKVIHHCLKGKNKLSTQIIFYTNDLHEQEPGNPISWGFVKVDLGDILNPFLKFVIDIIRRGTIPFMTEKESAELHALKEQYYNDDKGLIVLALFYKLIELIKAGKFDFDQISPDTMKTFMVKFLQTLIIHEMKTDSKEFYTKEGMAHLGGQTLGINPEEFRYHLFRRTTGEKMSLDTFLMMVAKLKEAIDGFKLSWSEIKWMPGSVSTPRQWIIDRVCDKYQESPTDAFIRFVANFFPGKKIMEHFSQPDESHKIPWSWVIERLASYTDPSLVIGTPNWVNAMKRYKTVADDSIPTPPDDSLISFWRTYWHLFVGMCFEERVTSSENIELIKAYLEDVTGRGIIECVPIKLAILSNPDRPVGCVPDLLLFVTFDDGSHEIVVIEIKSCNDFNPSNKKTRRSIELSFKQLQTAVNLLKHALAEPEFTCIIISSIAIIGNNITRYPPITLEAEGVRSNPIRDEIVKNGLMTEKQIKDHFAKLGIKVKFADGYAIFSYEQIKVDWKKPISLFCRGVILEDKDWQVVCKPFDKFFNYGDGPAPELVWDETVKVYEKEDGSIMKLWYSHKLKKWIVSTNNTIFADDNQLGDTRYTFGSLFWETLGQSGITHENVDTKLAGYEDTTFVFELCSPHNEIVVKHSAPYLKHLASFNNITLKEENIDVGVPYPEEFSFSNIDEVKAAANDRSGVEHEGFIVVQGANRWKVKSDAYVTLHLHQGEAACPHAAVLTCEEVEITTHNPELVDPINAISTRLGELSTKWSEVATKIHSENSDMKGVSLALKSSGLNKATWQFLLGQFSNAKRNKTEPQLSPRDIRIVTIERFNKLGTKKRVTEFTRYLDSGVF